MLTDLTPPSNDTVWQTGLRRKIQQCVVYRSHISSTETSTGLGWKAGRRFTKPMSPPPFWSSNTYLGQRDFKLTLIKQDKEGHSIVITGEIHQKEVTIIYLFAPKVNAPNFIKHTLKDLKTCIKANTVVVGDFNTPLPPIDRSSKQKISKL
jgi:hypothetical protein